MSALGIAEVSRRSGLPASALRYYEQRGLIQSIGREGRRRVFAESVLQRLALIALGQQGGLSLDAIGAMLGPGGTLRVDRPLLRDAADELEREILRLQRVRDALRHVAECSAVDHLQCPEFQKLLAAATRPPRAAPG